MTLLDVLHKSDGKCMCLICACGARTILLVFKVVKSWVMWQSASFAHIWRVSSQTGRAENTLQLHNTHTRLHTPSVPSEGGNATVSAVTMRLSWRQQLRCHESWGEKNLKTLTKKDLKSLLIWTARLFIRLEVSRSIRRTVTFSAVI